MNEFRKLLVAGLNEAVKLGKVSLDCPDEDVYTEEGGHFMTEIGGYPSVVLWQSIGFGELRFSVWWNYDHSKHPQANAKGNALEQFLLDKPLAKEIHYPKFVGAFACGWIERKTDKCIQGNGQRGIYKRYLRSDMRKILKEMPDPIPQGFNAEGKIFM